MKEKIHLGLISLTCFTLIACNPHHELRMTSFQSKGGGPITCEGVRCLAVGYYQKADLSTAPLLSFSTDGGKTFPISSSAVTLPSDAAKGLAEYAGFSAVTCSIGQCLAIGFYQNVDGGLAPLLAFSTDGGKTFPKSSSEVAFPSDAISGAHEVVLPTGISCSSMNCLIIGTYLNASGLNPFLSFSTDGGKTFPRSSSSVALPSDAATGYGYAGLSGVTCSITNCLAVGIYEHATGGFAPLLSFSVDGGATFPISSSAVMLPSDAASGSNALAQLSGITCSGSKCLAVGSYFNNTGLAPLISFSTDGGSTFPISASAVTLPSDAANSAGFSGIICSGANCLAVGRYVNTVGGSVPLISFSTDGGKTFPKSSSAVMLPSDAATGFLENANFGFAF